MTRLTGKLNTRAWSLVDWFIPRDIFQFDHREVLYKARALVITLLIIGTSQTFTTVALFAVNDSLRHLHFVAPLYALTSAGVWCTLGLFRRTGHFRLSANLYGFFATGSLLCLIAITGGFAQSPLLPWWPLLVMYSFIMSGWGTACLWTLNGLVLWGLAITMDRGFYVQIIPTDFYQHFYAGSIAMAALALAAVLWFFDFYQRRLLGRLQQERDKALFAAAHDPLTGLANRKAFEDRVNFMAERQKAIGGVEAVLMIDLNDFKEINDTLGHKTGDAVLKTVAARLRENTRRSDFVARLGGDEFAVLLCDLDDESQVVAIVEKLHAVITSPLPDNLDVRVGASVGVALDPMDGRDMDALLNHADQSMYEAKKNGLPYLFARDLRSRARQPRVSGNA